MPRKLITLMILSLSIFITGCSNQIFSSNNLTLEQSIKEIIISKGPDYNFLDDEVYIKHMEKLGSQIITNKNSDPVHYAIGNLNEDNIPELAVFKERDSDNIEDEGSLEIYRFNGEQYILLDSISMNFDITNYQIEIGNIAENQKGLFVNNEVGAHSGLTYGFILENGKLKSILNHDKFPLISIYTDNEIKDINDDGILNFSISTIDPETEGSNISDSDKMTLWYKWDEKDSGELVMVQRKSSKSHNSNDKLFKEMDEIILSNFSHSLRLLYDSKNNLSKFENTELLMKYIEILDEMIDAKSKELDGLFLEYQKDNNFDYLFKKYGLTMEKLNNFDYINREKVLKDERKLKRNLLDNISLGYKVATSEGSYYYIVDYQSYIESFGESITNEYKDYLSILALNTNEPFIIDGSLSISREDLTERILLVESFKMIYPYSNLLPKINNIYKQYINFYFYGDLHNPNFNMDTLIIKQETLDEYEETIKKYEYTTFSNIVREFMDWLRKNQNVVDDNIREKLNNRLD